MVNKVSSFDGMTDCVQNINSGFKKVEVEMKNKFGAKGVIITGKNPKEFSPEQVLVSIKVLINNIDTVSYTEGYFKWEG